MVCCPKHFHIVNNMHLMNTKVFLEYFRNKRTMVGVFWTFFHTKTAKTWSAMLNGGNSVCDRPKWSLLPDYTKEESYLQLQDFY